MDSSERRRLAEGRLVPRSEAWAQAAAERAVELVVSALDVNTVLDQVDLNAVLDQVGIDWLLDRIDLNNLVRRIDFDALVEQTDVIAASSSRAASDMLGLDPKWNGHGR